MKKYSLITKNYLLFAILYFICTGNLFSNLNLENLPNTSSVNLVLVENENSLNAESQTEPQNPETVTTETVTTEAPPPVDATPLDSQTTDANKTTKSENSNGALSKATTFGSNLLKGILPPGLRPKSSKEATTTNQQNAPTEATGTTEATENTEATANSTTAETTTITTGDGLINDVNVATSALSKEEITTLINILKDPQKLESLIKAIEGNNNAKIPNTEPPSKAVTPVVKPAQNAPAKSFIEEFSLLQTLENFKNHSIKSLNSFYSGLADGNKKEIITAIAILVIMMLLYIITQGLEILFNKLIIKEKMSLANIKFDAKYHGLNGFLDYAKTLAILAIRAAIPIFLAIIFPATYFYFYQEKFVSRGSILLALFGLLVLNRLIVIVFQDKTNQDAIVLKYLAKAMLWASSLFLIFKTILNDYFYNDSLLKLNLLVFLISFSIILFLMEKRVYRIFINSYNKGIKGHNSITYRVSKFLNYSFIIALLALLVLGVSILYLEYPVAESIVIRLIFSIGIVIAIYASHRIIAFIIYIRIIKKLEIIMHKEYKRYDRSLKSYKILSVATISKIFGYIYLGALIFLAFNIISNTWGSGILFGFLKYLMTLKFIKVMVVAGITTLIICAITFFILVYLNRQVFIMIQEVNPVKVNKLLTLITLLKKPYMLISYFIIILSAIGALGISVQTILASTGIITVFVAFGAKDILKNLFNGIVFFIEDSFYINDVVEIAGKTGIVEGVSLVYVSIRELDGRLNMVPFSEISIITNMSRDFSYSIIDVGVAYDSDINKVKSVMEEIGKELRNNPNMQGKILGDLEFLGVIALSDYSVQVRAKIKTMPAKHNEVKWAAFELINKRFSEEKIEIPYPIVIQKKTQ